MHMIQDEDLGDCDDKYVHRVTNLGEKLTEIERARRFVNGHSNFCVCGILRRCYAYVHDTGIPSGI